MGRGQSPSAAEIRPLIAAVTPLIRQCRGRLERGILGIMQEKREKWMELAAQAADEQDPQRLSELVREIDRLLAEKLDRIGHARIPSKPSE